MYDDFLMLEIGKTKTFETESRFANFVCWKLFSLVFVAQKLTKHGENWGKTSVGCDINSTILLSMLKVKQVQVIVFLEKVWLNWGGSGIVFFLRLPCKFYYLLAKYIYLKFKLYN